MLNRLPNGRLLILAVEPVDAVDFGYGGQGDFDHRQPGTKPYQPIDVPGVGTVATRPEVICFRTPAFYQRIALIAKDRETSADGRADRGF